MKKLVLLSVLFLFVATSFAQMKTYLVKTDQQFQNKEFVWSVHVKEAGVSRLVGEWWPVHAINLITSGTDPQVFADEMSLEDLVDSLKAVATSPDGMTTGYSGHYALAGKCLASGVPCGDGIVYNYGILVVENGYKISFTHKQEVLQKYGTYDAFYKYQKNRGNTVFFLPSIYRNGNYVNSRSLIDKVLVRRETPNGIQIGVMVFSGLVSYNTAREIVLAWDRPGKSKTTHIYMLDGGESWGQSAKKVNNSVITVGKRDPKVVTNYLVFY